MDQVFLSDSELYFTPEAEGENPFNITGDEALHIIRVMRHNVGDIIHVTNGKGSIFRSEVVLLSKRELVAKPLKEYRYENPLRNFIFCIPRLKVADRFEFAIEKAVELGITRIIVFDAQRSLAKGDKRERWMKIATAAMKQSLRSFLPEVGYEKSIKGIAEKEGRLIIFDQKGEKSFTEFLGASKSADNDIYCIFGPEGGLADDELNILNEKYPVILKMAENRLRAETAVITAAAMVNSAMQNL